MDSNLFLMDIVYVKNILKKFIAMFNLIWWSFFWENLKRPPIKLDTVLQNFQYFDFELNTIRGSHPSYHLQFYSYIQGRISC